MSNRPPKYAFGFTKPDPRTRLAFLLEAWSIYERRPAEPTLGWRDMMESVINGLTPAMRALLDTDDEDAWSFVKSRLRERQAEWRPVEAAVFDLRSLKTSGGEAGVYDRRFATRVICAAHMGLGGGRSFGATADALREVCGGHAIKASLTRNHIMQAVRSHLSREKSACEAADLPAELILTRSICDLRTVAALDKARVWCESAALAMHGPDHPRGAALAREFEALEGMAALHDAAIGRFKEIVDAKRGDAESVRAIETLAAGVARERLRLGVAEAA